MLAPLLGALKREPWVAALAALAVYGQMLGHPGKLAQARAAPDRGTALARNHGLAHVPREVRRAESLLR